MGPLILLSVVSMVLQNCLSNYVTKKTLQTNSAILSFQFYVYLVCVIIFGMIVWKGNVSGYTIMSGILFGVITSLSNVYKMLALTKGPMHLTLLFTTSSMIIPTLSGVFFGESFSFLKLLAVLVLLAFLYLLFEKGESTRIGGKWFVFCILAFLFQGTIGVLQKIHQSSAHKKESAGFLLVAFICAIVFGLVRTKGRMDRSVLCGKLCGIGIICGVCTFAMNYINLKLSGILPSQLFFPLINGSSIVLSSLLSVLAFKERLSSRQIIGFVGGMLSLIIICLVP